jgi:hypothetical protein
MSYFVNQRITLTKRKWVNLSQRYREGSAIIKEKGMIGPNTHFDFSKMRIADLKKI